MSLWDQLLAFIAQIVSPDWGKLVALLPLAVAAMAAVYFVALLRRAAMVGPARRLPAAAPLAPTGGHEVGPSAAPILAAIGVGTMLLTLVLLRFGPKTGADGGTLPDSGSFAITDVAIGTFVIPGWLFLVTGVTALVLALVFWLREATREGRAAETTAALPAVLPAAPPPGVHLPAPSFRPLLVSIGASAMLLGMALHPALLLAGLVMLVFALVGWLRDAAVEYRHLVRADATGHLEAPPVPRMPIATFAFFGFTLLVALALVTGVFPPSRGQPETGGRSPAPGASQAPAGGGVAASPATSAPAASATQSGAAGEPTPVPGGQGATVKISAQGTAFDTDTLEAPAGTPFLIEFANNDAGIPHNVAIRDASGAMVFTGDIFSGLETRTYQVPALPAGTYTFFCTVHTNMTGTLTVK